MDNLYRQLLQFSQDGVYRFRFENGDILLANQGIANIIQFPGPARDLIGRRIRDVIAYAEPEQTIRKLLQEKGEIHDYEYFFRTLKGEDRWVLIDATLNRDPQTGDPVVDALARNITDRKLAEQALASERDRLRVTLHAIGDAVIATDAEGRIALMNPVAERMTGWNHAEALGLPLDEVVRLVSENTRSPVQAPVRQVLSTGRGTALSNHVAMIARDGRERSIADSAEPIRDMKGGIIGTVLVFRDVTEERRIRDALLESETTYRLLFANLTEAFALHEMIFDDAGRPCDYRFLEVNNAFESMTGLHAEAIVGKRAREVFPTLEPVWVETYGKVVLTGEPTTFDQFAAELNRHYHVTAFRPREGQFAVLFLDVTVQYQAEEHRRRLESQAQHAQKLESLGVLSGGIAHDFNNLLVGVLGNADLALAELSETSPTRQYLQAIESAAQRASALCRQMLAYAGHGSIEKCPVDLNQVISETRKLLKISLSKKVDLRVLLADNLPTIQADPSQIGQVLMNLVINASEATGDQNGTVTIITCLRECDTECLSNLEFDHPLPAGSYVVLDVTDTGCGMDEQTRRRIFDPFFTTKFAGRGLGLSAVLGIVRSCQGGIRVISEGGSGTTFQIFFPVSQGKPAVRAAEPAGDKPWRGQGTVLVVDDEESVCSVTRGMLERMGFQVLCAANGRDAIEIYRQHPEIVFVLLDFMMPQMNGEETYRELQRLSRDVRVIISSGYNENEIADRVADRGVSDFIQKPYRMSLLREKVQRLLSNVP